jgi:hypothetical protein
VLILRDATLGISRGYEPSENDGQLGLPSEKRNIEYVQGLHSTGKHVGQRGGESRRKGNKSAARVLFQKREF